MKTYVITIAIIRKDNLYLVAKRARTKKFAPGKWEFITGFVEDHEAVEDTIHRELQEELSANSMHIKTFEPYKVEDEDGYWITIPIEVSLTSEPQLSPEDHEELRWLSLDELKNIEELKEDILNLIKLKAI